MQLRPSGSTFVRLAGVAALAGLAPLVGCASGGQRTLPVAVDEGEPFDFALPDLEGEVVRAADFRGDVVLLDVWATWCAPCEKSFPFYADLVEALGPQGFRVVAVSVDERAEDVAAWLEGRSLPFTVLHDPDGTVPERIGLRTMPTALLLDREGRVAGVHAGFDPVDAPVIERMVRAVLAEKGPQGQSSAPPRDPGRSGRLLAGLPSGPSP